MLRIKVMTERMTKVRAETLVLGFFEDVRPLKGLVGEVDWIHHGILSHLLLREKTFGKIGEAILLATQRKLYPSKILIMGLGKREGFTYTTLQKVWGIALNTIFRLKTRQCAIELFGLADCALDATKATETLMGVIMPLPIQEELDLFLLVQDENKARQIQQSLSRYRKAHD